MALYVGGVCPWDKITTDFRGKTGEKLRVNNVVNTGIKRVKKGINQAETQQRNKKRKV